MNTEEKKQLFLKSMDKKYEKKQEKNAKDKNLIKLLKETDKKYKDSYPSIHMSGRDFTDVITFGSITNPDDYYDESFELNKKYEENKKKGKSIFPFLEKTRIPPKIKINIETEISCIGDLLELTTKYALSPSIEYNIDMETLHKIKPGLQELNSMIGMKELKENIVDQILYYIQNLHHESNGDFLHTVIYGSPGTGKTEIAKMIGKIFCDLGVLKKGSFKKVVRSDLIGGYLGQTAIKTKEVIQEALGGVLFIDEAYALGNSEKRDSYSKECIDTLCEALSDHKDELMVIIAGYEYELKECFFDYNQGLDSRFTWRFKTDKYDEKELHRIFLKKITDGGWNFSEDVGLGINWFKKNMDYFKYYGRDMETLFTKTKIAHSRRIFCKKECENSENSENKEYEKKKITMKDLERGFQMYLKNEEVKNRKEKGDMEKRLSSIYV